MDSILLGLRIQSRRLELNMTQAALAERVGVSCLFIGHIERGSKLPSVETEVNICEALKVSLDDMVPLDNERAKRQSLPDKVTEPNKD